MGQKVKILAFVVFGVVVVLLLGILFTPTPYQPKSTPDVSVQVASSDDWRIYRSPSERFSVSFPTPPQRVLQVVPMPSSNDMIRYDMLLSQARRGTLFMVNIIDYPPSVEVSNPESVLTTAVQEIVAGNPKNQLIKSEMGTFYGFPGLEFIIGNPEANIHGRAILKDRSMFVMSVADHDPQVADSGFSKLANSFVITDLKQP